MTITTQRLVLRWWEESDAPEVVDVVTANLDHLRPWMPWVASEPLTVEQRVELLRQWRRECEAGEHVSYGVFLDGAVIGATGLRTRRGPGTLEIGYWIDDRHTGNGYVTEFARALTDAAFALPGIEHVHIHHDRANLASGEVPRRLGYRLFLEQRRPPAAPGESGMEWGWRADRERWLASA